MFSRLKTKRNAYGVYLGMEFASALFFSMIFTVSMVYQATTVGLNPLQLVLVGTTLEVAAFVFEVPTGVVADVISRRTSIIIGMFIMGVAFVIEGSVPQFGAILVAQGLWGLGYTFTSGASQAWIADEVGEKQAGQAFLRADQIGTIGALVGIVFGTLIGNVSINLPIVLGGLSLMGLGVALILVMPETGFKPAPREDRTTFQSMAHTFKSGVRLVRGKPTLINILVIGLVFGLYSEGLDRLWTPHFLQSITLPTFGGLAQVTWFGILRAGGMLLGIGLTEVARRRLDTNKHGVMARAVLSLNVAMVIGLFVFALTDNFVIALIAYWALNTARRTLMPLYTTWVNQHVESSVRATVISMSSQVDALGQIMGGPIVGGIGTTFGLRAALTSSAVILTSALPLLARVIRLDRHVEAIGRGEAANTVVIEEGVAID
ncbi:MAG: MFS transporter [Thermoflexales bacterium]|nr:MFS transporter [Thermoflexales bacterium]